LTIAKRFFSKEDKKPTYGVPGATSQIDNLCDRQRGIGYTGSS
jgi:hypothetical protein